jgi:hypothetical protein
MQWVSKFFLLVATLKGTTFLYYYTASTMSSTLSYDGTGKRYNHISGLTKGLQKSG